MGHRFALPMDGQVCLSLRVYLYGQDARAIAERDQAAWDTWMAKHFPAPDHSNASA
jgi:hypothetical protein